MIPLSDKAAPPAAAAPFNMAQHVLRAGALVPDRVALSVLGPEGATDWTYGRLISAVGSTAAALAAQGLAPGDRVLMRLGNSAAFPITFLGAIAAGLLPVPTSAQLTVPEVTAIAREVRPALIVAEPGIALPDHGARLLPASDLQDLMVETSAPDFARGDPERPAYIVYTSGTSGRPRAVVHAHRAILARRMMHEGWCGLTGADRLLHAGAFNWTYTLGTGLMDPWTLGATALIPAPGTPPDALPDLLARHEATIFAAAPGVFRQMLRGLFPPMPKLRHGLSAGEKLSEALRRQWKDATGTTIHEAYGMSECSTFLSGSPARPAPPDTLGYPQDGRSVALLGDGGPVPQGAPGIIAVHRSDPGLMLGYLDQPAETAARFAGDWFLTGDIGVACPDGAIAYQGRGDDMMNAGGYRVSPLEVEEALCGHPGVSEAAACEVRVKTDATVIAAFWTGPDDIAEAVLAAYLGERLARYKCPRIIRRVDALPRGPNNKLLRRSLRRQWEAAHGQA